MAFVFDPARKAVLDARIVRAQTQWTMALVGIVVMLVGALSILLFANALVGWFFVVPAVGMSCVLFWLFGSEEHKAQEAKHKEMKTAISNYYFEDFGQVFESRER